MQKLTNYINGKQCAPYSGEYIDNIDPSRGQVYSLIPRSNEKDVEMATAASKSAFPSWSSLSVQERGRWIQKLADGIQNRFEEFVNAESRDNGKPVKLAEHVDIPRAILNFSFFATAIQHTSTESHYMEGIGFNYTTRKPIGVVCCISPWNLPLYLFSWKIAPALAAGNCVVTKPSEVTPFTAYLLGEVAEEVGFPAGVLNIVHGYGHEAGAAMVEHEDIKAISFTGGTSTGAAIAEKAAPKFKKLSLELGGKNPNIIFADCDFDEMLSTTMRSSFANQGQICLCGSRILVEESIYQKFLDAFVEKVKKTRVSNPEDPKAHMGALVSKAHLEKVMSYIDLAKEEGGQILAGGKRVQLDGEFADGYYLEPTVIAGLDPYCRTNQEEIFGPVVTVTPFKNEAEALTIANSVKYGLSATIWTENLRKAHRVADEVEAGIVWINDWLVRDLRTPFGGVKASGVGREGGWEALRFFTEPKNIFVKR